MLPYALDQIDAATFQAICDQRFSESGTVDFKQELTRNDDKGKNELAKDVCALANADGGDLVYGVKEDSAGGTAESVAPLVGESYDDASRRLLQTLESWVEPRIRGIQLKHVPLKGGFGLVIRVPASFDGPLSSQLRVETA
ncbi:MULTISPECIES: ATP-binding protein [Variovorax]|jgi:predicted HTH transcriptional regulator|uniref:HTH transcriptional regulator n=1 Tax=Variovorax paradoxus TaxID=34073 RepID=A0AAE3Y091_VARPD|nr:ATP-binding protein [Variovorax paradoxus]MDR6428020.1 putative HTH transcriptional regulator [Variovorax paradoxus]